MSNVEKREEPQLVRGPIFKDRRDAGRQLAPLLEMYRADDPLVLALPRGGVPVGYEVARHLEAPLHAFPARKVGAPHQPELGIGAVAPGNTLVLNEQIIRELAIPAEEVALIVARQKEELEASLSRYWGAPLPVAGRTVILVDDGLATGSTASAALHALRKMSAARIVLAVPVCAAQTSQALSSLADTVTCVVSTDNLSAVGLWYDNFEQTSDQEVAELLGQGDRQAILMKAASPIISQEGVVVQTAGVSLEGDLHLPNGASGVVLFAHGSGSSRHSERNRYVARVLNEAGFGTLLIDLLTVQEEQGRDLEALKFDIPLLAERLTGVVSWLEENDPTKGLRVGLFGASTGAGAALLAASERPVSVAAVVSRGGRVDLAGRDALNRVIAPTLLIVGELDNGVLELNRQAQSYLFALPTELKIVPHAGHLFVEPGALEEVARLAVDWFSRHLMAPMTAP